MSRFPKQLSTKSGEAQFRPLEGEARGRAAEATSLEQLEALAGALLDFRRS